MSNLIGYGSFGQVRTTEHVGTVGAGVDPCTWAQRECASRGGSMLACTADEEFIRYSCGYDFAEKDIPPTFVPPPRGGTAPSGGTTAPSNGKTMYAGVSMGNWLLIAGAAGVLAYILGTQSKTQR